MLYSAPQRPSGQKEPPPSATSGQKGALFCREDTVLLTLEKLAAGEEIAPSKSFVLPVPLVVAADNAGIAATAPTPPTPTPHLAARVLYSMFLVCVQVCALRSISFFCFVCFFKSKCRVNPCFFLDPLLHFLCTRRARRADRTHGLCSAAKGANCGVQLHGLEVARQT